MNHLGNPSCVLLWNGWGVKTEATAYHRFSTSEKTAGKLQLATMSNSFWLRLSELV